MNLLRREIETAYRDFNTQLDRIDNNSKEIAKKFIDEIKKMLLHLQMHFIKNGKKVLQKIRAQKRLKILY